MTEPDIPREELEAMFEAIRENTEWDLDGDLLWGYFFTHSDRETLEKAAEALEADGYELVQIFEAEEDGKGLGEFFLHVERVETHSVDSLHKRNVALTEFADQLGLESYDGMDVGPVEYEEDED
ncbi:hypothetical protein Mal4_45090 [Maioricimonas rarisocia]|uniref:Regulator of ribonuclease activity B domain-containing protein n=1 Tax=Maioricimonas rarisocia TaxID=2528026 RepID=A0A517ZCC6_9PLAN|nr:ribonuclease E inhibitor RraB [Maioricimonas rarisocia]QDU40154.1 hypothetical protein Mal4_45090 [Maioricimonas rarisocia]